MVRNELYIEILQKLIEYLDNINIITDDEKESINDQLILTHYSDVAQILMNLPSAYQFKKVAKIIYDGLNDTSEVTLTLSVRHHIVPNANVNKLMSFRYKTADLAVMPVKTIVNDIRNISNNNFESIIGKILELIWIAYKDNPDELKFVWECCAGSHETEYFLLTNEPDNSQSNWRLYSYAYFCYVNNERFDRPSVLNFNKDTPFSMAIPYYSNNEYEQYFDVYNVISESKYSEDVLSRYLRMYQILEYMAYRKVLAEMTKGNIKENGFIRNVINRAKKSSNNELDELKKGLKSVIPNIALTITSTDITSDMNTFIKNRLMIKNTNHDDAKLWEVVYKLRNCVVHNKESELHFMYANTLVYEHGILLMNMLISKIEPIIISTINDPNMKDLEFENQEIRLY